MNTYVMAATTPVHFDFRPYGLSCFSHTHDLPTSLVGPNTLSSITDGGERFHNAIDPILAQHREECLRESRQQCMFCGSQVTKVLQHPSNSLFHSRETDGRDLSVQVLVLAFCGKSECERAGVDATTQVTMNALGDQVRADKGACQVCGKDGRD